MRVRSAQKVAEWALKQANRSFLPATPRLSKGLSRRDKGFNQQLFDKLAEDLGYRVPLPESLSKVVAAKIYGAEKYGSASLRPLLLLALLCAEREESHLLHGVASETPELLLRIDALAGARDRAAHDQANSPVPDVKPHVETAFLLAQAILHTSP